MVWQTLDLWVACRVIERTWVICGEETLGISRVDDPTSTNPWEGTIPITPTMDTQLDQLVIKEILAPLRTKILLELSEKIEQHRPADWFEICLTIFILLSSIEVGSAHGDRFARRYGRPVRYLLTSLLDGDFRARDLSC